MEDTQISHVTVVVNGEPHAVLIDGRRANACLVLAVAHEGFVRHDAFQRGDLGWR